MHSRKSMKQVKTLGEKALSHLWTDEDQDVIVLTRHMTVYPQGDTDLVCYCWSPDTFIHLRDKGLTKNVIKMSHNIHYFTTDCANIDLILSMGAFKRRPTRNGRFLKSREKLVGHNLLPLTLTPQEIVKIISIHNAKNTTNS
ncbi:hypothetical protein ACFL5H_03400 [Candidatus Latescibacterota bacterium]